MCVEQNCIPHSDVSIPHRKAKWNAVFLFSIQALQDDAAAFGHLCAQQVGVQRLVGHISANA